MASLTTKQQAFIESYLRCWNAAQAARDAGYTGTRANQQGQDYLSKPVIQAAIQERLAELKMGADEVLVRLSEHARGSTAPFMRRNLNGELLGFDLGDDKPLNLLHKVTITKRTVKELTEEKVSIELYDAQAALALLGKHHKLFGDSGGVLKSLDLSKLNPEQLQRMADGEDPIAVLLNKSTTESTG